MKKRHKILLSDLKKICAHLKLNFSKVEVVRKTAFALDTSRKKLVLMDEKDHPYFKTIDLRNIDACAVKVDYKSIGAGDLDEKNMEDFVDKIQLQISHIDPSKSVNIGFYDTRENNVGDLQLLVDKAEDWRDKITSVLPRKVQVRA
jgi:hypothetical protein